jgi:hypothetical protein
LKGAVANFTEGAALQAVKALEAAAKQGDLQAAGGEYRRVGSELDRLQTALLAFCHRQQRLNATGHSASWAAKSGMTPLWTARRAGQRKVFEDRLRSTIQVLVWLSLCCKTLIG